MMYVCHVYQGMYYDGVAHTIHTYIHTYIYVCMYVHTTYITCVHVPCMYSIYYT